MTAFARIVLVCFLASTCLLKHTLSRPFEPIFEDEAFNEIDFEEVIPAKEYDNVDEDPDFNPDDYYDFDEEEEDYVDYEDDVRLEEVDDKHNDDDVVEYEEEIDHDEGQEDDDDENGREDNDEDMGDGDKDNDEDDCEAGKGGDDEEDKKCGKRKKRDLGALKDIDEEIDPEEEAMELEEDRIPLGKDVVDNPYGFHDGDDDDESVDFDEERDVFKDALGPDGDERVDFDEERDVFKDALGPDDEDVEDDYESNVEHKEYFQGGDDQLHQDDEDDKMDSGQTEETDELGIKESIPDEDHEIKVDVEEGSVVVDGVDEVENPSFVKKLKRFMTSISSFLFNLDRDKN